MDIVWAVCILFTLSSSDGLLMCVYNHQTRVSWLVEVVKGPIVCQQNVSAKVSNGVLNSQSAKVNDGEVVCSKYHH